MHPHDGAGPGSAHADRLRLFGSLALSLFFVTFLWGFFTKGTYALGWNATFYFGGLTALFLWALRREGVSLKANLAWIVPVALIVLSYAIYDNPFLKGASLLALPATFALFYNDAVLSAHGRRRWSLKTVELLTQRMFAVLTRVHKVGGLIVRQATVTKSRAATAKRVIAGLVIFAALALLAVIPLLSSADAQFAASLGFLSDWVLKLLKADLFPKVLVLFLLTIGTASALLSWSRPSEAKPEETDGKAEADTIVAGIVLGGLLLLYAFFLWIQVGRLWIGELPIDFGETERLVKGGFWQLLALTGINILLAFALYKKTVPALQRMLLGFAAASLLLLASAGQRMGLYVMFHGLSYEKFFASYALIYCAILLLWLGARLTLPGRADIARFPMMLFLWMFAVATLLPVERIILSSNVSLKQREGSRIHLYELQMLSPDVLDQIRAHQKNGTLRETTDSYPHLEMPSGSTPLDGHEVDWNPWIQSRRRIVEEKAWYELTLSNLLTQRR